MPAVVLILEFGWKTNINKIVIAQRHNYVLVSDKQSSHDMGSHPERGNQMYAKLS